MKDFIAWAIFALIVIPFFIGVVQEMVLKSEKRRREDALWIKNQIKQTGQHPECGHLAAHNEPDCGLCAWLRRKAKQ